MQWIEQKTEENWLDNIKNWTKIEQNELDKR